ncbi:MAG: SET domain-containing protein-lysine N-methyltransferase [Bacteroidetes bacterium]|nr:SET domain-containing protein-lysine N-methyltransferase [Bacteroidota bacterium]
MRAQQSPALGPNELQYNVEIEEVRGSGGQVVSRLESGFWQAIADGNQAAVYIKNSPFRVEKSSVHGVGLFTDAATSFQQGDSVCTIFYKVLPSGPFLMAYRSSVVGTFINDSQTPNTRIELRERAIILRANRDIPPNTEILGSYRELISLFPNDKSAEMSIKYW